jgi:hypothetical protein
VRVQVKTETRWTGAIAEGNEASEPPAASDARTPSADDE